MTTAPDLARMKGDLAGLVAIDSQNPPGFERTAAAFVGNLMSASGFEVRYEECRPDRTNVIGSLVNGDGPVFAFNTHLDVVPAGEGWTGDPLVLREADGRLHGRGACDAKGCLVAMIEAMRLLAADRKAWSGTLLGVFVADEEVASAGARHFASGRPAIDFVVVGEPTSNTTVIAHKGSLRPLVRVHGTTAHSGTPHLGVNAIYKAAHVVGMVERMHREVIALRTHPLVGSASLTITRAQAGTADNILPDRCDLLLDRRMIPGEDEDDVKAEIEALLSTATAELGVRCEIVDFKATTGGASETERTHAIVTASLDACRRHAGAPREPHGFSGGCDLVHFRTIGAHGTVIGPGSLGVAHKPDEFVPVDEFAVAPLIYRDVALAMLGRGMLE